VRREIFDFDGLRVPVEIRGSASEALVFLPGLGSYPGYYRTGLELLSRDLTVVMPDLSFRTHRSLPRRVSSYVALIEALAGEYAPEAPWCGHSFGGLLALLSPRPAIACAPCVPIRTPFPVMVARAVHLQLTEYAGSDGLGGARYAGRILLDYVLTVFRAPRALFPIVNDTIRGFDDPFLPIAKCAVIYLSRSDSLYRSREYAAYFDRFENERVRLETLEVGHDWPVNRPNLVHKLVLESYTELCGGLCPEDTVGVDARRDADPEAVEEEPGAPLTAEG
jgi:pimeloyl-ACP methyl ester carboxylesterase